MTVREFISQLQEALDRAAARSVANREVIVGFIAPNSGFCGPTIRPKYLGETNHPDYPGPRGRYGLTRLQVERLLEAFDVTLPEKKFA
jgi:hypothetical protein